MRFLTFVALVVLAIFIAGIYGALHDQLSFTVSQEYFTKFKYHQFGLANSDLPDRTKAAAIGWMASWRMGVPIGLVVGAFGFLHKPARRMFRITLQAMGVVAFVALLTGILGLTVGWFFESPDPADHPYRFIPKEGLDLPRNFIAVGSMHNFSYLGGVIGLVAGVIFQFWRRERD